MVHFPIVTDDTITHRKVLSQGFFVALRCYSSAGIRCYLCRTRRSRAHSSKEGSEDKLDAWLTRTVPRGLELAAMIVTVYG
jgi:hypothetical protein